MHLKSLKPLPHNIALLRLPNKKLVINTINAHSYNVSRKDPDFDKALRDSDVLLADGAGIVIALFLLQFRRIHRIAGYDLFQYEMKRLNKIKGKCFFLGSSDETLQKMRENAAIDFPNVKVYTYSPPFKTAFSDEDNEVIIKAINKVRPDALLIGLTAPKQEKWAMTHAHLLQAKHIGCIGAVFDFYAGNTKRAPIWIQQMGMEWAHRFSVEPKRLWKRYLYGNLLFAKYMMYDFFTKPK
ncbi:MAG: WecB/TagA/CpsF family glycosyltransferase [Bacteroidales bacterium]|nr:WecB/TagA/CpsF family glycosyltransferase [Bacteroidales bacterium]